MLFRWLFRSRRLTARHRDRFVSQFRRELAAQRDWGMVSESEFDEASQLLDNPITAQKIILRSRQEVGAIDWPSIIQWVESNWATILKLVLTFAFLVLGTEDEAEANQLWPEE